MKIVSFKICPFVQRVTGLLEAKQLDYAVEYIDLSDKPQWFLDVSPNAQVPLLITDANQVLFESDAIVEYLDEAVGSPLASSDLVAKAQDRAWSALAAKNYLVQCGAMRSPDAPTLAERAAKLAGAFAKIEARLGSAQFANGQAPGMVDVAWLPLLHRAAIVQRYSGYNFLAEFPRTQRWQDSLLATGLADKSVAADFEERFAAFYLTDATYLGQLASAQGRTVCCSAPECAVGDMSCCS